MQLFSNAFTWRLPKTDVTLSLARGYKWGCKTFVILKQKHVKRDVLGLLCLQNIFHFLCIAEIVNLKKADGDITWDQQPECDEITRDLVKEVRLDNLYGDNE